MATYKIGVLVDKKHGKSFDQIKAELEEKYAGTEDKITVVDITDMSVEDIQGDVPFNGLIYYADALNSPNQDKIEAVLSVQSAPEDLNIYCLSQSPVTTKVIEDHRELLDSFTRPNWSKGFSSHPVQIRIGEELHAFLDGFVAPAAQTFFDVARPVEKTTEKSFEEILSMIEGAFESKHAYTAGHVARVSTYVEGLANQMGLPEDKKRELLLAAKLHDVGKLGIPDYILKSPKDLSDDQRDRMGDHSIMGAILLESAIERSPEFSEIVNSRVLAGIKYHHIKWDELGEGKKHDGLDIGELAPIIAVADCIDAMTSQRAYNNPKHILDVFRDLNSNKGKQFKPDVAEAAIIMLGRQIASLGYDPLKLVPPDSEKPGDDKLQAFLMDHAQEFEGVELTTHPDGFCDLGFKLDESGYFILEGERAPQLDEQTRFKSERDFQIKKAKKTTIAEKTGKKTWNVKDLEILEHTRSMSEKEKSTLAATSKKLARTILANQDKAGQEAMDRARMDISEQIPEVASTDTDFRTGTQQDALDTIIVAARDDRENGKEGPEQDQLE